MTNADDGWPSDGIPYVTAGADLTDLISDPPYRGQVDLLTDGLVAGWCVSTRDPLQPVPLELWIGDTKLTAFATSTPRPEIEKIASLSVRPGFSAVLHCSRKEIAAEALATLEAAVAAGETARDLLSVRVSGQPVEIEFARHLNPEIGQLATWLTMPIVVSANLDAAWGGPSYRGFVDGVADGVIAGWCVDIARPNERMKLEVYYKDVLMGVATTTEVRNDINALLKKVATSGFAFRPADIGTANLKALISAFSAPPSAGRGRRSDLAVKVADSNCYLDFPLGFSLTAADVTRFAEAASGKLTDVAINGKLDLLRALAEAPKRVAPEAPRVEETRNSEDVGVVAFYLPQFHPFPENDEWWGTGFTEWTNVASAKPRFRDHNQPRIPADLGYYDLRLDAIHEKQIALARRYNVSAFCYYYYSFSGKSLMTFPIERHFENDYDLDFCLCWANENWSRRWDGSDAEILIQQSHSESDDDAFIDGVIKYFGSRRYLKIDGAPLLLVYRISLLSNPAATIQSWKSKVRAAGFPDLHVSICESFGLNNPIAYGADSSCQFPPHGVGAGEIGDKVADLDSDFSGKIFDYVEVAAKEVWRPDVPFLRFRTAMPSWDNTSRKGKAAHIFHNASPAVFEAWLSVLCAKAMRNPPGRRLVFVNAWNEWAEGTYLEPDRRDGHRNLKAVRAARRASNLLLGGAFVGSPKDGDAGAEMIELISCLGNANRRLLEFATDYCGDVHAGPSPFVALPPGALRREGATNGNCNIETINGKWVSNPEVTIDSSEKATIAGWVRYPNIMLSATLPVFLQLVGEDGREYIASLLERFPRKDITEFFHDEGEQHYGFNCSSDFRNVEPGVYRLHFLIGSVRDPNAAFSVASRVSLIVA